MDERGHRGKWATIVVAAGLLLGACSAPAARPSDTTTTSPHVASSSVLPGESTTTQPSVAPPTAVATSVSKTSVAVDTVLSTTTSLSTTGPLEFTDGKFLGIRQGSLLTDAAAALGVTPVQLSELDPSEPVYACTGTPDPWVIRTGGLTLVFESSGAEPAFLTNWRYVGGPVASFTEMVAPYDIRIGDTRAKLEAAYPGFTDLVDEIDVSTPMSLRFGVENGTVNWFGIIDCVMEGEEPVG